LSRTIARGIVKSADSVEIGGNGIAIPATVARTALACHANDAVTVPARGSGNAHLSKLKFADRAKKSPKSTV